jgi:CheY-like chemotaxis protein
VIRGTAKGILVGSGRYNYCESSEEGLISIERKLASAVFLDLNMPYIDGAERSDK